MYLHIAAGFDEKKLNKLENSNAEMRFPGYSNNKKSGPGNDRTHKILNNMQKND